MIGLTGSVTDFMIYLKRFSLSRQEMVSLELAMRNSNKTLFAT
jgi:hypothetical protein